MTAITVQQPYAALIAAGAKRTENRDFRPVSVVGKQLAIHAGKHRPTDADIEEARQLAREDPDVSWRHAKRVLGEDPESWPYQRVVAVVMVGEPRGDQERGWRWPLKVVRQTTSPEIAGRPGFFDIPAGKIRTIPVS